MYDRISGVLDKPVGEGTHIRIPWFQTPTVMDIRTRPRSVSSVTGTKGACGAEQGGCRTGPAHRVQRLSRPVAAQNVLRRAEPPAPQRVAAAPNFLHCACTVHCTCSGRRGLLGAAAFRNVTLLPALRDCRCWRRFPCLQTCRW